MKIIVALDTCGHFVAQPITKRNEVIKLIQTFDDGDYWANEVEREILDIFKKEQVNIFDAIDERWEKFLNSICQRGTLEIVEIPSE